MKALRDLSRSERLRAANLLRALAWACEGDPHLLLRGIGVDAHGVQSVDYENDPSLARVFHALANEAATASLELSHETPDPR